MRVVEEGRVWRKGECGGDEKGKKGKRDGGGGGLCRVGKVTLKRVGGRVWLVGADEVAGWIAWNRELPEISF